MKRTHTLIITLICMTAFAASSLASLSYGAELPGAAEEEVFVPCDVIDDQTGSEVSNLRTAGSGTCGKNGDNVSWTLNDEGTLTISGTGDMEDYPDYEHLPLWCSSSYSSTMTTVVIEKGVTSIGNRAFYRCENLQSVTIPSGVKSIGDSAFYECENLEKITIPSGVTSIGFSVFSGCKNLQRITIPSTVTSIENTAFYDCEKLEGITIPSGVTSIGARAFHNCSSLETVYYGGPESAWDSIRIGRYNEPLKKELVQFDSIFATGVSLNKESLTLAAGETFALSAKLIPEGAVLDTMIWSSANPWVAAVDDNGTVTAAAEGETTVTVVSAAWGYSADCSVVVTKAGPAKRTKPTNTFVGGQKVDVKSLYFSSHPEATRFQSSSKKTASVNKKGIMKAKKPGIVTIEAQTGKKKAERKTVSSCSLTILDRPKLKFNTKYSVASDIGKVLDGYEFFTTMSTKQTAADLWESSKPAVAEINPETGAITIKGKGTATITAYFGKKGEKGTLKVKAKLKVKK